jgi:hypothetical protein
LFLRQFIINLASTQISIDANTRGWTQEEKRLATEGNCLATGRKGFGHSTDCSLIVVERDLGTLRKGFTPLTERFGVLSPRTESRDKRGQAVDFASLAHVRLVKIFRHVRFHAHSMQQNRQ